MKRHADRRWVGAWTSRAITAVLWAGGLTLAARAGEEMVPFPIDWANLDRSVIDGASFLKAPAGQAGFVRVDGSRLVFPDGARFRVWGVNVVADGGFPTHDEADRLAADLARLGVNAVRFHGLDASWGGREIFEKGADTTRRLDAENLDRFDYLVASLKQRGIYSNINLNVFRTFRPGDGVRDAKLLGLGKSATFFNPRLVELQKEYARQLLTHRNAYTGKPYTAEPAVLCIELVNENSVLEGWCNWRLVGKDDPDADGTWRPIPTSYARELTDQYNAWLEKAVDAGVLERIRKEAGAGPEGRVERLRPDQFAQASAERFHNEARFYLETEQRFFQEMQRLLVDELGVQSIVVGTADHNDGTSGYPHIRANMTFPLIDGHGYWQHPDLGKETRIQNTPMVNDPLDSTVVQFARTPVAGRPFWISETNHPFPHENASEGIPILTAYALLHDWDGIWWFTWGHGSRIPPSEGIRRNGWFDLSPDPVKLAMLGACGLIWHRHDIQPAKQTVVRVYTEEQIRESLRMDRKERPFFTPGFARSTPLAHATRWTLEPGAVSDPFPPAADLGRIVSDTSELAWIGADAGQGVVTIVTPRAEARIGFVQNPDAPGKHLDARLANAFASVLLTSRDGQPIASAGELLLVTGGRVANTEQAWQSDRKTLAAWGHGPVRIEPIAGTIRLKGLEPARRVMARRLSAVGMPEDAARPAQREGSDWVLPVGDPASTWYAIGVER